MGTFSDVLIELRKSKGLTQKDLSKICNLSPQCISALETGVNKPTGTTLGLLADYFNVSTDFLLGRTDEFGSVVMPGSAPVLSQEETQLLDDYRALTPALKKMILETIKTFKQAETASSSHKIS